MERLPNLYHVPGVVPHMEYHYPNNRSVPSISRHPTEQMFGSFMDAPGYDLNNTMQYACNSSRALPMIASPEPNSRSTLLFDVMQASQQQALLNSGSYCGPSEYSGLATSSESYDPLYDSRFLEEVDSLSRRPIDGFEDGLSCSTPYSGGILRPIRDGEVTFAGVTASKVVDGYGVPHSNQKDLESAKAGLEMEEVLRNYFQDVSEQSFHPSTSTRSFSTHNPTSTERRDQLQAPPSPSSQAECNASSVPSQSGLPDRLASLAAPSELTLSRPTFKRSPEGVGAAEFNAIREGKQQIPSAGGDGLTQGPSPLPFATLSEGSKLTRTRPSTMTIDGSERSRLKRQRTRGDSKGETRRINHIARERNRRNQIKDHLCTLRDFMPSNFFRKTDRASIVEATVEYVKQLEVALEYLQSVQRSRRAMHMTAVLNPSWNRLTRPAPSAAVSDTDAGFRAPSLLSATPTSEDAVHEFQSGFPAMTSELFSSPEDVRVTNEVDKLGSTSAGTEVEVMFLGGDTMLVNILTPWREKQIVKVIVAIESLYLTIWHTRVNTVNNRVHYEFDAEVGPKCRMTANEIAAALHQIFNCQVY